MNIAYTLTRLIMQFGEFDLISWKSLATVALFVIMIVVFREITHILCKQDIPPAQNEISNNDDNTNIPVAISIVSTTTEPEREQIEENQDFLDLSLIHI